MKKLLLLIPVVLGLLGFSSCCASWGVAGSYEEDYQIKTCRKKTVTTETVIDAKAGLVEVTKTKVPVYKNVKRKVYVKCQKCTRYYCLKDGCCGSVTEQARKMATAQPASGSPHIGLIPTMKPILPEE